MVKMMVNDGGEKQMMVKSKPNDGEKSNQPKRRLFPKCDYGKILLKCVLSLAFSRGGIYPFISH